MFSFALRSTQHELTWLSHHRESDNWRTFDRRHTVTVISFSSPQSIAAFWITAGYLLWPIWGSLPGGNLFHFDPFLFPFLECRFGCQVHGGSVGKRCSNIWRASPCRMCHRIGGEVTFKQPNLKIYDSKAPLFSRFLFYNCFATSARVSDQRTTKID